MYLRTYVPSYPLNNHIALFTYYKHYSPDYSATKILPDGSVELLILLDDIERVFYKGSTLYTRQKVILTGVQQEHVYAKAAGSSLFAIKFKVGGSYPFLHLPVSEISNLFIDAEQLLGESILFLREQLLASREPQEMFALVETYLLERFIYRRQPQQIVNRAIALMQNNGRSLKLGDMAEKFGYSHKQFIHLFKKHVGLSPKYCQRMARFNKILEAVGDQQKINWSQLGQNSGFYDQAHLINDFKYFSGMAPQDYLAQRGEFPHFIPIYQKR